MLGAMAGGVAFDNLSDVKLSYSHYEQKLTFSQKVQFAQSAVGAISSVLDGYKPKFDNVDILKHIKDYFLPGKTSYEFYDTQYGDIYTISSDEKLYVRNSDFKSGKTVSCVYRGQLFQIHAPSDREILEFYRNGELVFTGTSAYMTWTSYINSDGNAVTYVRNNNGTPMSGTTKEYSSSPVTTYPIVGGSVAYNINPSSYVGSEDEPGVIALPGLPYVPGVTLEDHTGGIVFPGSMEDLLSVLENDSTFLDALLERLLGKDNTYLDTLPALNPVVTDDGIVYPGAIDKPDVLVPDVPVVEVPDFPVVDAPGFGWLIEILNSIYNLLKSILNLINSFISNLLQGLLNMLKSLFVPRSGILSEYVATMEYSIKNKIGSNLYTPLFDNLKSLKGEPIPDLYIKGSKVLDASYVNSFAEIVKSWQRWLYYILIALYNINSIYKLIRNGEMISRSGGVKK